ncbi:MAG: NAD(P)H-dependent oxidoreductase subunit E, partial [Myxococcales bacterium]|nr:NAD(P)H-dependent oxidoreductase subunit E [Myxococcales bacterium]
DAYKYLSKDVIDYVASSLGVPASRIYGVATFYSHFALDPKGRHILRICDGTACHVKKSHAILQAIEKKLGLSDEKRTTADLMFTIELVSCLGACGLAPVMVVDEAVHGQATSAMVESLIDDIIAQETAEKAAEEEGK